MHSLLRQQLRPEFLNRIDDIIVFHALSKDEIAKIVDLQFKQVQTKLAKQGIRITLADTAKEYLAGHGYQPEFGARPLKRLIQREIVNELAKYMLEGNISTQNTINIKYENGALVFETIKQTQ